MALILLSQTALADFKEDIDCLAKNIYFESRNQPWVGKIAVAQVTLNRVESMLFPSKICDVVKQIKAPQRCQFSWFCDGKSDEPFDKIELKAEFSIVGNSNNHNISNNNIKLLGYQRHYSDRFEFNTTIFKMT